MEHENKYEQFLVSKSIYNKIKFDFSTFGYEEFEALKNFLEGKKTLDLYCPRCQADGIFTCKKSSMKKVKESSEVKIVDLNVESTTHRNIYQDNYLNIAEKNEFIWLEYRCAKNPEHKQIYIIKLQSDLIKKIGQEPSFADIEISESKKYEKILGDKYKEYNKALGLSACNVGAGSFVYLRRIIEKLVLDAYHEALDDGNITEDEFEYKMIKNGQKKRNDFSDKVKLLEGYLPEKLVNNNMIYKILSNGVHELTEEECNSYFPVVKGGIDLILAERLSKQEKSKAEEEIYKGLNKINSEIKNK